MSVDFTAEIRRRAVEAGSSPDAESGTRDLTQDGLALELGDRWRKNARYVAAFGRWYFADESNIWREDDRLEHMTRTRAFLREVAAGLAPDLDAIARKLRQADTVTKVVGLARSNVAQAAAAAQWDADPWLLGTPNGTVDLRSGALRPTLGRDYITKTTAVSPAPAGTRAPLWEATLARITRPHAELGSYLQRLAGYALTGLVQEHVFAFAYGLGANGKSTVVNAIQGVMGDYAISIPSDMLMVSAGDRHPTELAMLRGVRLAVGSEIERERRWAEARIKTLTGGDPIRARFMRQDYFEFEPQLKLWLVGNHRPSFCGVDESVRRRLHLLPFTVTIPEDERDPELPDKLREEWPAILRWMIDGCLLWQRQRLSPPRAVQAATAEYLEGEDAVTLWIEECATRDPNAWEKSSSLFKSWKTWAEAAREPVKTQKALSQALEDRGFPPKREGGTGTRGSSGLRLNLPADTVR